MPDSPSISVRHLRKVYGEIVAVDDLTFTVPRGAVLGLLGGNGAGKTTTIAMLLGLLEPTAGQIEVLGVDMLKRRYAALPRMNFSSPYVDLPQRLTVRQNLVFYGRLYGVRKLQARVEEIAERMQIAGFLDRPSGKLSAGQKTRVAIAKALINRPEVLLLDEPTASLDPDTADWMRSYLKEYQRETGATILLASHNMGEVERLCDDVILLQAGRVFERGSPRELIERFGREDMEEVFLDMARGRGRGLDALKKGGDDVVSGSIERIHALVMRHVWIWRSSVMRLVDSIYWPAVQMVMWGFLTQYLLPQATFIAQAAGVLLSGLLLWEVVVRGNLSLSIAFLEEMWSRNLGHLFVSPIRSWEMAAGIIIAALLRTLMGMIPVSLMAWAFFGYSIYDLGLPLVAFFAILQMFSWSIGLAMSGMIMRVGQSAESFAWAAVFILMPVSGVYYPVSVLPQWLQTIAWALPTAYVFEGMRAIMTDKIVHWDLLGIAFGLSAVYLVVGFQIFQWFFRASRRAGTLLGQGE